MRVFLGLGDLTQNDIFYFSPFACKVCDVFDFNKRVYFGSWFPDTVPHAGKGVVQHRNQALVTILSEQREMHTRDQLTSSLLLSAWNGASELWWPSMPSGSGLL